MFDGQLIAQKAYEKVGNSHPSMIRAAYWHPIYDFLFCTQCFCQEKKEIYLCKSYCIYFANFFTVIISSETHINKNRNIYCTFWWLSCATFYRVFHEHKDCISSTSCFLFLVCVLRRCVVLYCRCAPNADLMRYVWCLPFYLRYPSQCNVNEWLDQQKTLHFFHWWCQNRDMYHLKMHDFGYVHTLLKVKK